MMHPRSRSDHPKYSKRPSDFIDEDGHIRERDHLADVLMQYLERELDFCHEIDERRGELIAIYGDEAPQRAYERVSYGNPNALAQNKLLIFMRDLDYIFGDDHWEALTRRIDAEGVPGNEIQREDFIKFLSKRSQAIYGAAAILKDRREKLLKANEDQQQPSDLPPINTLETMFSPERMSQIKMSHAIQVFNKKSSIAPPLQDKKSEIFAPPRILPSLKASEPMQQLNSPTADDAPIPILEGLPIGPQINRKRKIFEKPQTLPPSSNHPLKPPEPPLEKEPIAPPTGFMPRRPPSPPNFYSPRARGPPPPPHYAPGPYGAVPQPPPPPIVGAPPLPPPIPVPPPPMVPLHVPPENWLSPGFERLAFENRIRNSAAYAQGYRRNPAGVPLPAPYPEYEGDLFAPAPTNRNVYEYRLGSDDLSRL
jgi:hypothetical protein